MEAFDILEGKVNNYLSHVCIVLASNLNSMAKKISVEEAKLQVEEVIRNKKACYKPG